MGTRITSAPNRTRKRLTASRHSRGMMPEIAHAMWTSGFRAGSSESDSCDHSLVHRLQYDGAEKVAVDVGAFSPRVWQEEEHGA